MRLIFNVFQAMTVVMNNIVSIKRINKNTSSEAYEKIIDNRRRVDCTRSYNRDGQTSITVELGLVGNDEYD